MSVVSDNTLWVALPDEEAQKTWDGGHVEAVAQPLNPSCKLV